MVRNNYLSIFNVWLLIIIFDSFEKLEGITLGLLNFPVVISIDESHVIFILFTLSICNKCLFLLKMFIQNKIQWHVSNVISVQTFRGSEWGELLRNVWGIFNPYNTKITKRQWEQSYLMGPYNAGPNLPPTPFTHRAYWRVGLQYNAGFKLTIMKMNNYLYQTGFFSRWVSKNANGIH